MPRMAHAMASIALCALAVTYAPDVSAQSSLGTTRVIHYVTDRCLDSNSNGEVYTLPCNSGNYQKWTITGVGSLGYQLKNYATGRCLDSNSKGNVYTSACNGGSYQRWQKFFSTVNSVFYMNKATVLCLDANQAGNVYSMGCNSGIYQVWR